MNKLTNILLSLILIGVILNLLLTGSVIIRQQDTVNQSLSETESLDSEIARAWGVKVVDMYNRQDHQTMYALFNEKAKVQISYEKLKTRLEKLHGLFGDIEETAFVNSVKVGDKGSEQYFQILFNVRVKESRNRLANLKLTVSRQNNTISLYGVRITASQNLGE